MKDLALLRLSHGRFVKFLLLLACMAFMAAYVGCSAESAGLPVSRGALETRFPEQAFQVVGAGSGFAQSEGGFVPKPRARAPGFHAAAPRMEATLPLRYEAGLRFRDSLGFAITIRELGVNGEGVLEQNAVTYRKPGGQVYWTCDGGDSCEEWLLLERGTLKRGQAAAVWEVDGATLRQAGSSVEVVDRSGRARMRVSAPKAYGDKGALRETRLEAQGSRLELYLVGVDDEAVLVDPAWESVGSMSVGRFSHTATLLSDGRVLVAGGVNEQFGTFASAELYDPIAKTWSATGSMSLARQNHTATLLPTGKVLVVGGAQSGGAGQIDNTIPLNSAELYDPATGSWSSAGTMIVSPRYRHSATLLPNGRVLIAGGYGMGGGNGAQQTAEEYDPVTGLWAFAGFMATPRAEFTATLLQNGRVLIAGGNFPNPNPNPLANAELYDSATQQWLPTGALSFPRFSHAATLMPNGQVLVASGSYGLALAESELYDPETEIWLPAGSMSTPRFYFGMTLVPSGAALAVGGFNSSGIAGSEAYNTATKSWYGAGAMTTDRALHTLTPLPSGEVLIVGGIVGGILATASAEVYESSETSWRPTASLNTARADHTATLLQNNRLLVAGGVGLNGALSDAFFYDSEAETWSPTAPMSARYAHTATRLADGGVLLAGGTNGAGFLASAELYNPSTNAWLPTGSLLGNRQHHTATLLPNGKVLVTGGYNGSILASAELYNPQTGVWNAASPMGTARSDHAAVLLFNGKVLVTGGTDGNGLIASAEIFDPLTESWSATGAMNGPRDRHTATVLSDGRVLVAGGGFVNPELYDPTTETWTITGNMHESRVYHAANLMPDGQVLVVGGAYIGPIASAEVFNPSTGTWSLADAMNSPRYGFTATLLPNGRVLAVGGISSSSSVETSAELFTPATLWDRGASMYMGRAYHTVNTLADNSLLVVGGIGEFGYRSISERYNPATKTWSSTCTLGNPSPGCSMNVARAYHTATTWDDFSVIVAGGVGQNGNLSAVERFDPATNTWMPDGQLLTARAHHSAVNYPGTGYVLIAGGWGYTGSLSSSEAFVPAAGVSIPLGPMSKGRWKHTAMLLPNLGMLVIGGWGNSGPLNDAEILLLPSGQWVSLPGKMSSARQGHTATLLTTGLQAGKILVVGGSADNGPTNKAELLDMSTGIFSPAAPMAHPRSDHFAVLLPDGRVLVAGGIGEHGPVNSAELYDPSTNIWVPIRALRASRSHARGVLVQDGSVLATGGIGIAGLSLATSEIYSFSPTGAACEYAADCQSSFCADGVCCNMGCGAGPCDVCSARTELTPSGGQTAGTCVLLTGPVCNDGNACTQSDICQTGVCIGSNSIQCVAPDQCQNAGVCDQATGQCSSPTLKNDGAYCDDNNPCTSNECQMGQCAVTAQTLCPEPDQCHEAVSCDLQTGNCPDWPAKADGSLCNDGNFCTKVDTCKAGVCMGANAVQCPQPDACHEAVQCDTLTGECPVLPAKPEGSFCDDGNTCTQTDICLGGLCTGTNAVQCPKPDQCHEAVACDPTSGLCPLLPPKPEGSFCDDGNACTKTDICLGGACAGTAPVECPQPDSCHEAVACNPATGGCPELPAKPVGAYCPDDNDCTINEVCSANGTCEVKDTVCDCAECVPYRCFGKARSCLSQCQSVNDCAPGFVCDRMGACITPPSGFGTLDTGCAVKQPGSSDREFYPQVLLWLLSLGLGGRAAKRRSLKVPGIQRPDR